MKIQAFYIQASIAKQRLLLIAKVKMQCVELLLGKFQFKIEMVDLACEMTLLVRK